VKFPLFRIPAAVAALLHSGACWYAATHPDGNFEWFPIMVIDFPVTLILYLFGPETMRAISPLLWFGVLGTLWWYFVVLTVTNITIERNALLRKIRKA